MEFASEMVVKASLASLKIAEVPTTLSPDGRQRPPHLRPWRDGWRHLRFMFLRSPQWLFLYPGLLSGARLDGFGDTDERANSGFRDYSPWTSMVCFTVRLRPSSACRSHFSAYSPWHSPEKCVCESPTASRNGLCRRIQRCAIVIGACLVLGYRRRALCVLQWGHSSFGALVPSEMMRITIPSVTALAIGTQILFGGFMLGFIEIE